MPLLNTPTRPSPPLARLALGLGLIALVETLVMIALHRLLPEATTPLWIHIGVDALALTAIAAPPLWWLFVRPLARAAQETRRQVQVLLDTAGEGIISTDEQGHIFTFNRAAQAIFGFSAAEVLGRNVSCLMPEPEASQHDNHMHAYRAGAGARVIGRKRLMRGRRKNGEIFPLEIAVADVRIGGRRIFTSVVHDVSAYKAAEAALSHTTALLERILATIPAAVAYLDRDFNFVRVNEAYARADGRRPEFFVGKNHFALYPDPENEAIFRRVMETGEPYEERARPFVYPHHPERGVTYWDVRIDPLKDGQGKVTHLLLTLQDVTAHKRLEAALQESEENARALLDAIDESALLITPEGVVLAINETAARRLGQAREALLGRNLRDFIPDDVTAAREPQLAMALTAQAAVRFEHRWQGRDYQVTLNPIHGPAGVRLVAVYGQDITDMRRHEATERLLREADEHILRGTPPEELMAFICDGLVRTFGLALAWFGRREKAGSVSVLAAAGPATGFREDVMRTGMRWDDAPTGRGPTGTAIRLGRTHIARVEDAGFAPWREAARRHGLGSACSIPVLLRGEVYGAFTVFAQTADAFDDDAFVHTLENIAGRAAVALEASFEHEQLRLLSAALATAANAVFITDRTGRIQWVNDAFCRLSGYSADELLGNTPRLLKSGVHEAAYYDELWATITAGKPWMSQTTERRKDGSLYTVRQIITPVRDAQGRVSHFIAMHEDISETLAAQARIERMAHFDAVTGLPNRSLFFDRLTQALALNRRSGEKVALLFLDLDRFKPVNDTYGHAVGDALLKAVGERLSAAVRESDTVARIAGDEFTVILPGLANREDAARVAEKIIRALGEPFQIEDHTLSIGVSIGIAVFPDDATDPDALMRSADNAMYAAKAASRNTYRFHAGA